MVSPLPPIQVIAKTPSGKNVPSDVNFDDSIRIVKKKMEKKEGWWCDNKMGVKRVKS
jgi:hypothetical protein